MNKSKLPKWICAVALLLAGATQAQAAVLFTLPNPTPFRNASWSFGEIFTVGSQNLTVTGLGAFDAGGDGFVTNGGIPVGIFRESDAALLVSTNVTSADPLFAHYRYQNIAPLTLLAGEQYRVVAVNRDDLYNIDLNFLTSPLVTYNGYGYTQSTTLVSANSFQGNERVWMANLQFEVQNVPEPATMVIWSGIGLLGMASAARRRFRKAS